MPARGACRPDARPRPILAKRKKRKKRAKRTKRAKRAKRTKGMRTRVLRLLSSEDRVECAASISRAFEFACL